MCRHTEKYGFEINHKLRNPAENILEVWMRVTVAYKTKQKVCALCLVSAVVRKGNITWAYVFSEDSMAVFTLFCRVSSRTLLCHLPPPR